MYKLKIKTMETVFEKFENIRDILSDKTVLDELAQYMTSDSLSEFVEQEKNHQSHASMVQ